MSVPRAGPHRSLSSFKRWPGWISPKCSPSRDRPYWRSAPPRSAVEHLRTRPGAGRPATSASRGGPRAELPPLDLAHVLDVRAIAALGARLAREPAVEDLRELRLGGRTQAESEDVGVVPPARAAGRRRIQTQP